VFVVVLPFCFISCWHWVKWDGPASAVPKCDAFRVISQLSTNPQPRLTGFDRFVARISTPFKRRGLSGWRETYCEAHVTGRLVRDAQRSTDGFWTMDLRLSSILIEPKTTAHITVDRRPPRKAECVAVGGVVVVDTDADFLEIHPDSDYALIEEGLSSSCPVETSIDRRLTLR